MRTTKNSQYRTTLINVVEGYGQTGYVEELEGGIFWKFVPDGGEPPFVVTKKQFYNPDIHGDYNLGINERFLT